jgi:hypothetical protein
MRKGKIDKSLKFCWLKYHEPFLKERRAIEGFAQVNRLNALSDSKLESPTLKAISGLEFKSLILSLLVF